MYKECLFNSERDIQEVVPDMATDINTAMETGVVMDTGVDGDYNDIDDPRNIMGRVESVFEAMDLQRKIGKAMASKVVGNSSANNNTSVSTPEGGEAK